MVIKKSETFNVEKNGVNMRIYNSKDQCPDAAVVYQETAAGHSEEFYHSNSTFIFYIIEGYGKWFIEDIEYNVEQGDVVIIPKNSRFYYKGKLKQICITAPAWEEKYEHHVRMVEI